MSGESKLKWILKTTIEVILFFTKENIPYTIKSVSSNGTVYISINNIGTLRISDHFIQNLYKAKNLPLFSLVFNHKNGFLITSYKAEIFVNNNVISFIKAFLYVKNLK